MDRELQVGGRFEAAIPAPTPDTWSLLLHFDGCARISQFLFDCLRFFLRNAFFDGLWSSLDEILRFFQAKGGNLANDLDHVDLVATNCLKDYVKLRLLFSWRAASPAAAAPPLGLPLPRLPPKRRKSLPAPSRAGSFEKRHVF